MYEMSRKHPRLESRNLLEVTPLDSVVGDTNFSKDVSESGCKFVSNDSYGVGKILIMQMRLSKNTIKAVGKVAWEEHNIEGHYDVGVEFIIVSPSDQDILKNSLN